MAVVWYAGKPKGSANPKFNFDPERMHARSGGYRRLSVQEAGRVYAANLHDRKLWPPLSAFFYPEFEKNKFLLESPGGGPKRYLSLSFCDGIHTLQSSEHLFLDPLILAAVHPVHFNIGAEPVYPRLFGPEANPMWRYFLKLEELDVSFAGSLNEQTSITVLNRLSAGTKFSAASRSFEDIDSQQGSQLTGARISHGFQIFASPPDPFLSSHLLATGTSRAYMNRMFAREPLTGFSLEEMLERSQWATDYQRNKRKELRANALLKCLGPQDRAFVFDDLGHPIDASPLFYWLFSCRWFAKVNKPLREASFFCDVQAKVSPGDVLLLYMRHELPPLGNTLKVQIDFIPLPRHLTTQDMFIAFLDSLLDEFHRGRSGTALIAPNPIASASAVFFRNMRAAVSR